LVWASKRTRDFLMTTTYDKYSHYKMARAEFWLNYEDIGLKLIPKCGTSSIRTHLNLDASRQPIEAWEGRSRRCVVLRHPLDRFMSYYKMQGPPHYSLARFIEKVLNTPDRERNWHIMSVKEQVGEQADEVTDWIDVERWNDYGFLPHLPSERLNRGEVAHHPYLRPFTEDERRILLEAYATDLEFWRLSQQ